MTARNNLTTQPIHSASLGKRMLQGGGIALVLITAFLISAGEGNADWPKYWMIRPLIIVPLAGAMVVYVIISWTICVTRVAG